MKNPKLKKSDHMDVKLGSGDMAYWKQIINAKKLDIQTTEDNLKFYKFIVKYAEQEFKKAEEKFLKQ